MPRRRRPPRAGALTDLPPLKILRQIVLLQSAYYLCATVLILFTTLVAGKKFEIDLILSWRSLRGDTTVGWTLGLCWMLNSFLGYGNLYDMGQASSNPGLVLIMALLQSDISSSPRFPLKTRTRLCHYDTPSPPPHYFFLLPFCAKELAVVGSSGGQRYLDDILRDMELSMARTKAHEFWW